MTGENSQREETAAFFAQSDLYSQLRDVFTAANRNNAAIYTLDPRGLAPFEFGIDEAVGPNQDRRSLQMTQDTLRSIADETDGAGDRQPERPGAGPGADRARLELLLPDGLQLDAGAAPTASSTRSPCALKRRGVDVRARKGYWALTAEDITRANRVTPETPKPVQQALASIATSVQAGQVRADVGRHGARRSRARRASRSSGSRCRRRRCARRDQPQPGRVSVIAADPKGDLVFRGRSPGRCDSRSTAPPALARSARRPPSGPQRLTFDAPPGELELRMSVEAAAGGGTLDSEIRTIAVPDLTSPDAAISTPRVHRARTARDFQTIAADAERGAERRARVLAHRAAADPVRRLRQRHADRGAAQSQRPEDGRRAGCGRPPSGGTHQIDLEPRVDRHRRVSRRDHASRARRAKRRNSSRCASARSWQVRSSQVRRCSAAR